MTARRITHLFYLLVVLFLGAAGTAVFLLQGGGGKAGEKASPIPPKSQYRIGILQSGDTPEEERMRKGFLDALAAKGYREGEKITVETVSAKEDKAAAAEGARSLIRGKSDLIAAIGGEACSSAAGLTRSVPIVGIGVLDLKNQEYLSGHENITGMTSVPGVVSQLTAAKRLVKAQKVGVLYPEGSDDAALALSWLREGAARKNLALYEIAVKKGELPEEKAKAFAGKADAVYIIEGQNIAGHFSKIMEVLSKAKVPVIGANEQMVRKGALASLSEDYYRIGFSAGLMAAKLLKGGILPDEIPIGRQRDPDLVINMAAARHLGIELPNDLWQKARKLYLYDGQPARP